ncbi:MAG: hypothetical protein GJ676_07375 [Rhodobacteraceae bacterium]|nr:hypothetical protein [Paracoccaceae bacterium]
MSMQFNELEAFYEDMASMLDALADKDRELFLCKLSLLLARELADGAKARELVHAAANHLKADQG